MNPVKISENPISDEVMELIHDSSASAARILDVEGLSAAEIIHAVDECVRKIQTGDGPYIDSDDDPEHVFGSLWGQQLVQELGWEWASVIFHGFDDLPAVGVFSPDRSLAIYPFNFIFGCLEDGAPVTIELAYQILTDGKRVPPLPAKAYENVMEHAHHDAD
jgi:hypothetical protein